MKEGTEAGITAEEIQKNRSVLESKIAFSDYSVASYADGSGVVFLHTKEIEFNGETRLLFFERHSATGLASLVASEDVSDWIDAASKHFGG